MVLVRMVPVLVHARKRTFSMTKTTISNTICWLFKNYPSYYLYTLTSMILCVSLEKTRLNCLNVTALNWIILYNYVVKNIL